MEPDKINKLIDERVRKLVPEILKSTAFTARKLTDMPTESLQLVNRKYVTLNGTSANRPTASVIGQPYFDTTLTQPIWWSGTAFVDADGNVV